MNNQQTKTLPISQPIRYANNPVKRDLVAYLQGRGVSRDLTRTLDSMRVGDVLEALVSQSPPAERDPGRH